MEVIKRAKMNDGTKIQIENWRNDYPNIHNQNDTIATYPIAKNTNRRNSPFGAQRDKSFRLAFYFNSEEQARKAFEQLETGIKSLKDFIEYVEPNSDIDCI